MNESLDWICLRCGECHYFRKGYIHSSSVRQCQKCGWIRPDVV